MKELLARILRALANRLDPTASAMPMPTKPPPNGDG